MHGNTVELMALKVKVLYLQLTGRFLVVKGL